MPTRDTRLHRGTRHGRALTSSLLQELRVQRTLAGVSQAALARELGWSQSEYSRFERNAQPGAVTVLGVCQVAALLGLELSAGLHPAGPAIRDKGHQALITRLRALLSPAITVQAEVPLPGAGDPRVWDLILRLGQQLIGVEAETRIRDIQALTRRVHGRERDGGVDEIIVLLSDSTLNRRLVGDLRLALGERYATSARRLLPALRTAGPEIGSGVLLV